jgi:hypothetical protein
MRRSLADRHPPPPQAGSAHCGRLVSLLPPSGSPRPLASRFAPVKGKAVYTTQAGRRGPVADRRRTRGRLRGAARPLRSRPRARPGDSSCRSPCAWCWNRRSSRRIEKQMGREAQHRLAPKSLDPPEIDHAPERPVLCSPYQDPLRPGWTDPRQSLQICLVRAVEVHLRERRWQGLQARRRRGAWPAWNRLAATRPDRACARRLRHGLAIGPSSRLPGGRAGRVGSYRRVGARRRWHQD